MKVNKYKKPIVLVFGMSSANSLTPLRLPDVPINYVLFTVIFRMSMITFLISENRHDNNFSRTVLTMMHFEVLSM